MRWMASSLALAGAACSVARPTVDRSLATYIDTLTAIDSHAHPMAVVAPGTPPDTDYDALPLGGIPPFALPAPLRPSFPAYRDAQRALYGVASSDSGSPAETGYLRVRATRAAALGDRFPVWVLDRLHIGVMLANRVAMGPGLVSPRFRWVAFADPLMLPLDVSGEATRTPDVRALYPLEAKLLRRHLAALGFTAIPPTLAQYQHDVALATIARQHAAGAVAIKFEAAYLRTLDFEPADSASAAAIYARYARGGVPTSAEYRTLEDYLIRFLAREAGRFGMAVQIHVFEGFGGYYSSAGAAPHLLESLVSDPALANTHFILIHGGWPLTGEMLSLLGRANVYTDLSMIDQVAEPAALAATLRIWLWEWPEKVLFGTDAFDGGPDQSWDEVAWVASHQGRAALAAALEGMIRDREITGVRAREIARMVLHDNATQAYHLGS